MSCSKPGLNAAGRSLYSAYGAPHTRFHEHLKAVDVDLRARGKNPNAPASDALTQAQLERMRITADQAARHGDTTPAQQATITKHLDGAQAAAAAGQRPKVREVVALRRMHSEYAPRPDAQARLAAATSRAARAKVAAGQLALRQARGDAIAPATAARVTQERADALTELQAATTAAAPSGGSSDAQRCPTCGEFVGDHGHECRPAAEGADDQQPPPPRPHCPTTSYGELKGQDRVTAMTQDLESSVRHIVESGQLRSWMDTMASNGLTRWSANNRMLAAIQLMQRGRTNPNEWHLMSFNGWKDLGRHPRKGAKAIWILKPSTRRVTVTDPDSGQEETRRVVTGFSPHAVFDVADTDGRPLDTLQVTPPRGEVSPGTLTGLKARVAAAGYTYEEAEVSDGDPTKGQGTLGYTTPEGNKIVIDSRLSPVAKSAVLAHELGHVHCGHVQDIAEYRKHRGRFETEAEMAGYLVTRSRGLAASDANSFSPAYIATWSGGDMRVVQDAMARACEAHKTIMDGTWPDRD